MTRDELYHFADWVASEVCREDFEESNIGAFVEITCRKLYSLGIVKKEGDSWAYYNKTSKS